MTPSRYCESCRARVDWVTLGSGKRMPVDPDPDRERGNVMLIDEPIDSDVYATPLGRHVVLGEAAAMLERQRGTDLYVSHFDSCPDADRWRKKRQPEAQQRLLPERRDLE